MKLDLAFFLNSILLGAGLAMDAFSVSLANGLNKPSMRKKEMCLTAGVFSLFQAAMPLIGWVCVHTIVQYFSSFEKVIPWIALILLGYIGGKMLIEGIKNKDAQTQTEEKSVGFKGLIIQGIATSIDALSVGFTIADYDLPSAVLCAVIIAAVTFVICAAGIAIGKKFGTRLSGKASILGGVILIGIGIEILVSSFIG